MNNVDFSLIRQRADRQGNVLNKLRDNFFQEIVQEHLEMYGDSKSKLYDISYDDGVFKLDLSPIGVNVQIEEKFIFLNRTVVKQISFTHRDDFTKEKINIINFFIGTDGQYSLKENGEPIGLISSEYSYDIFFPNLFDALKQQNLLTSDY